jgi:alpha-mannosidase
MKHKIRWTLEKITQRLALIQPLVYKRKSPIPPFFYMELESPLLDPPISGRMNASDWETIPFNSYWGKWGVDFVLRSHFKCPEDWDSSLPLALFLPMGNAGDFIHPEALLYIDGQPYASCDRFHQEISLPLQYNDGQEHQLALHGWTGLGRREHPDDRTQLYMRPCFVVQPDPVLRKFIATARVTIGVVSQIDEDNPVRSLLLSGLDRAFCILDTRTPQNERFYDSIPAAQEALNEAIEKAGFPIDLKVTAAGHAHLDVAWLWTLGQTRRKAGRTFHNVLHLMDQFPKFYFSQSQPQLYEFVRKDYPALFEGIQRKVLEGRWEAVGGMWVEADCNLTGAEALTRQFLLGRNFYREYFGEDMDAPVLWLPDVFGYAWNLPQLIRQAGLDYFFTIKIGWNQYNRMPYDSFWWQGLDGTRVLTHYSTTTDSSNLYASTYNARATPEEVLNTWNNFQQKDLGKNSRYPPVLMSYGYGDGGGGPTMEMLENIQEMENFPGLPHIQHGKVKDFFEALEDEFGESLPTWNGELYLEYHRGTYTTQARNKRANRKSEILLHNTEFLSTFAKSIDPAFQYPHVELDQAWKLVCLNQFHDIIPGSSIQEVYVESLEQYEKIRQSGEKIINQALKIIEGRYGGQVRIINPSPVHRNDLAFLSQTDLPDLRITDGRQVVVQQVEDGTLLDVGELAPYSLMVLEADDTPIPKPVNSLSASEQQLENDLIRVAFDQNGDIISIFDKIHQREILPPGTIANQFQAFEDRPMRWDAWDIDIYYDDRVWFTDPVDKIEVIETGPLRASIRFHRKLYQSKIIQQISIRSNSARIDFDTWIDWHQQHTLLKVAFPVKILTSAASYEIQWGHVQRPTHSNTSWDWARFETCAHKWADVSEADYGVSLLNDCKYGYDIKDSNQGSYAVMRLSLLRGPTNPDPQADQGEHRFTYSLFPHTGPVGIQTISEGYTLNQPLIMDFTKGEATVSQAQLPLLRTVNPILSCDQTNILIETIKWAEDGNGWILRLYDSLGQRGIAKMSFSLPIAKVWQTNLLEENQTQIALVDGKISISYTPFQIITLRIIPGKE